jgi:hypothetical protein
MVLQLVKGVSYPNTVGKTILLNEAIGAKPKSSDRTHSLASDFVSYVLENQLEQLF